MKLTLALPSLVWPQALDEAATDLRLPGLARLVGESAQEVLRQGPEEWLARQCGLTREHDWPIAPVLAQAEFPGQVQRYWLLAEPVHLQLGHDDVVLRAVIPALPQDEAQALLELLNRHFAEDGWVFQRGRSGRWYLGLPAPVAIETSPPRAAMHRPVRHYLPRGEDARPILRAITEIQMLLHEHALNRQREERGELAVNSLWLWGGGQARSPASPNASLLLGGDAFVRQLAQAAGARTADLPADARNLPGTGSETLLWLDALDLPQARGDAAAWHAALSTLERQWLAPLAARADRGECALHLLAFAPDAAVLLDYRPRGSLRRLFASAPSGREALRRVQHWLDAAPVGKLA